VGELPLFWHSQRRGLEIGQEVKSAGSLMNGTYRLGVLLFEKYYFIKSR
jgi:hypothetical protein